MQSQQTKTIKLRPIKESTEDYEKAEEEIKRVFREYIYKPLLVSLGSSDFVLRNADDPLVAALRSGRVTFSSGRFNGKFSASVSKALKALGAKWDRKTQSWVIRKAELPPEIVQAISSSEFRFIEKMGEIDDKLAQILPAEIADRVNLSTTFDRAIWKTQSSIDETLKNITVLPKLSPEQRKKIAEDWENNMKLYIKDFTEKEISKLRASMKKSVFAGNRYESAISSIQESYGVSANKAKFLARQETSLLMAKFKQVRYEDAGVDEYEWRCVAGSKLHPVRPAHKALEGKIFKWQNPPVTTSPGETTRRNNPGQDYNCRCFARPIVRFKK